MTISPVVNVSVPQGGKPEDGSRFGAEISRAIVSAVQSELVNAPAGRIAAAVTMPKQSCAPSPTDVLILLPQLAES